MNCMKISHSMFKNTHSMIFFTYVYAFSALHIYCIAGFFRGRKLSRILRFCGDSRRFSPRKSIFKQLDTALVGVVCTGLLQIRKFSPAKIPLYGSQLNGLIFVKYTIVLVYILSSVVKFLCTFLSNINFKLIVQFTPQDFLMTVRTFCWVWSYRARELGLLTPWEFP